MKPNYKTVFVLCAGERDRYGIVFADFARQHYLSLIVVFLRVWKIYVAFFSCPASLFSCGLSTIKMAFLCFPTLWILCVGWALDVTSICSPALLLCQSCMCCRVMGWGS